VRLARRAGTTFRQVGKPRLFLDLLLILLGERPARTYQQINEEAAEKAERHQEREEAKDSAIGEMRTTILPGPDGQANPETEYKHQGTPSQDIEESGEHRRGGTSRKHEQKHQTNSFFAA
jgi:hypothetical protein